MKLNDIHFHDSIIYRVTEDTEKDSLTFEVDYPVDWKRSIFKRRVITFSDVLNYEVHECAFSGAPTILDWSIVGTAIDRAIVRLETNAGYRQFAFKKVGLGDAT